MRKHIKVSYNRKCAYCGKEFVAHDKRKEYCSRRCKDTALEIKKGIKVNSNVEPYHKICIVCGKSFDTFREVFVTCSHECAQAYKNGHVPDSKRVYNVKEWVNAAQDGFEYVSHTHDRIKLKCKCCGNIVERARATVKYKNVKCEYCKEAKQLQEARQEMACFLIALKNSKTPKQCACCGETFFSVHPTQKYCSDKCKKGGSTYRSRCKHYGVYYDPSVTRIKVVKRDKNKCQLCGKICNPNDKRWGSSGPDFPTLDHIVPLSKGGTHTWDNVQCACGICNSYKRDLDDPTIIKMEVSNAKVQTA
jgi:predicted nucleic acid-binding Zn ribbon protein